MKLSLWALAGLIVAALLFGCGSAGESVAKATGQVVNADKAASSFTLQPLTAWSGFTPTGNSVGVSTNANTVFRDRSGNVMTSSQWYDFVAQNAGISTAAQAAGTYANGVITAAEVQLQ